MFSFRSCPPPVDSHLYFHKENVEFSEIPLCISLRKILNFQIFSPPADFPLYFPIGKCQNFIFPPPADVHLCFPIGKYQDFSNFPPAADFPLYSPIGK